jgi:hypothetical protein
VKLGAWRGGSGNHQGGGCRHGSRLRSSMTSIESRISMQGVNLNKKCNKSDL